MKKQRGKGTGASLRLYFAVIISMGLLAGACDGPASTAVEITNTAPAKTASSPPASAMITASPAATEIPGFEGWSVINPQAVDIKTENGTLVMTLTRRALWFMTQRGVLLYEPVTGNFKITAEVHTSKSSDTSQPPGGDGSVQLAGVMARNGEGYRENYAFIVVGMDADGISVETKNTVNGMSKFEGPAWNSADAELQLCRVGKTISLYKRHAGTGEAWIQAASYDRPDLPATLQAGLNIYTDGQPDIQAMYDHIQIEAVASAGECGQ